jgi:pectate lyase
MSDGETTSGNSSSRPTGEETSDGPVVIPSDGEVRAFPGATGFGAMATGGRGGRVIKVTNLNASGPGSLQEALSARGARIIVFAVSGVIEPRDYFEIGSGDVTIAGQTAPGGGITLKGRLYASYDNRVGNFIIRHIRVRPKYDGSEGSQFDSIQFSRNHTIIMDHVSVGFGIDETVDLYSAKNITVQWSTIESPTPEPSHEGGDHHYGLINGPDGQYISVHHNLFAHSNNRNPAIANGPADVLNNVMYDVRIGFVHHNPASGQFRLVGNYFKDGPNATLIPFYFDDGASNDLKYYVADNWVQGRSECSEGKLDNPWQQCNNSQDHGASYRSTTDFDFTKVDGYRATTVTSPQQAYTDILAKVGAFPRDVVTRTTISNLEAGTGVWGAPLPSNLMEGLTPATPPTDADDDGMADDWERAHGLNPEDGTDHTTVMESGYTAIEEYINELAERLIQ